jgi:hypothetical protein
MEELNFVMNTNIVHLETLHAVDDALMYTVIHIIFHLKNLFVIMTIFYILNIREINDSYRL